MAGLVIRLMHSTTRQFGDIHAGAISQGTWAGDKIVICTAEQLDDFESYTDVSNPGDIEVAMSDELCVLGPARCFRCHSTVMVKNCNSQ